jgi:hypothetical protein
MPTISSAGSAAVATPASGGVLGLGYAVPLGWGELWRAGLAAAATTPIDVSIFGDSTTFGSGANYSWVQRLRDRCVAAGYADGGKGVFGYGEDTLTYDAPEVNGLLSNGWTWNQDGALSDILAGYGLSSQTSGETVTIQGRIGTGGGRLRIWWVSRGAGSFTYSIDGAPAVSVTTTATLSFTNITGLTAGTHTVVITNTANVILVIAPAFMNNTGVCFQKYARSGAIMEHYFDATGLVTGSRGFRTQYAQAALGLTPGNTGSDAEWRQPLWTAPGAPRACLSILDMGFNNGIVTPWSKDIAYTSGTRIWAGGQTWVSIASSTNVSPPTDSTKWQLSGHHQGDIDAYGEAIHEFCRLSQAAGADPLVVTGLFTISSNGLFAGKISRTVREAALSGGAAWIDFQYPTLGRPGLTTGLASTNNPHLNKPGYVAQADRLWDKVLFPS